MVFSHLPLFKIGFRLFFLGAASFAVVSVLLWTMIYALGLTISTDPLSVFQWHAHGMIFGYSFAVICGFLLTAVGNWTGVPTANGGVLLAMFGVWVLARLLWLAGSSYIYPALALDTVFVLALTLAVMVPIVKTGQKRQIAVVAILGLLVVTSLLVLLGVAGHLETGVSSGLFGATYLVVGLILIIGGRVIPFFTERSVGYPVKLFNHRVLDVVVLGLMVLLIGVDLYADKPSLLAALAFMLCVANSIRLLGWYTYGIWSRPLLWSLYLGYAWVTAGFGILCIDALSPGWRHLAVHSFAYGGIGTMTLSMMIRVSLGHTGRDVHSPPPAATVSLVLLQAGALCRILMPAVAPDAYSLWIVSSQLLWIAAFTTFLWSFAPVLVQPRLDGRPG